MGGRHDHGGEFRGIQQHIGTPRLGHPEVVVVVAELDRVRVVPGALAADSVFLVFFTFAPKFV